MPKGTGNIGRGEQWCADELTRRGHLVVQQHPVWRFDGVGQYFIDVTLGRVAIELLTHWEAPWENDRQILRTENLILDGWRVFYVWIRGSNPEPTLINSILEFKLDVDAGSAHWYRAVDGAGKALRIGWLNHNSQLMTESAVGPSKPPLLDWKPEPPEPPTVPDPPPTSYTFNTTISDEQLAIDNAHREEWYHYEKAFKEWEAERQRRKPPWVILPSVEQARGKQEAPIFRKGPA